MKEDDRALWAGVAQRMRAEGREHAEIEELVAYQERRLPEDEAERLRDHLAVCEECLALYRDLEDFEELESSPGRPIPSAEIWRGVGERLDREPATEVTHEERARGPSFSPLLAAAVLLVFLGAALVLGLALVDRHQEAERLAERNVELERRLEELARPQLELPTLTLRPPGSARGGDEPAVLEVPPGADVFALTLVLPTPTEDIDHRLEILDAQDRPVFSEGGLKRTEFGTFQVVLSRSFLAAGRYRLRVFAERAGSPRLIEEYELEIRYLP